LGKLSCFHCKNSRCEAFW